MASSASRCGCTSAAKAIWHRAGRLRVRDRRCGRDVAECVKTSSTSSASLCSSEGFNAASNHGFGDAETQAGVQPATRVSLGQSRQCFGDAGVIVNGALGFIGESRLARKSATRASADARGRAGCTTRTFVLHMRARFDSLAQPARPVTMAWRMKGSALSSSRRWREAFSADRHFFEFAEGDRGVETNAWDLP
jgi:hypothetical protein